MALTKVRTFESNFRRNGFFEKRPIYLAAKERKERKEKRLWETDAAFDDGDFKASRLKDL